MTVKGTFLSCAVCGKEIRDENFLYCRFCWALFHKKCIHLSCPVCGREVTTGYGESFPSVRTIPREIRRPRWPYTEEVPLFEEVRPTRYRKKKRMGFFSQFRDQYLFKDTVTEFRRNKKGMLGMYMLLAAVIIAVLAPLLILHDPVIYMAEDKYVYHPPTWKYPLGTDVFGRDVYSQVVWGFRSALAIALSTALLVGIIGTVVGLFSGYCGGMVDAILQRISVAFLVWPSVPLVALIVFSWGPANALLAVVVGVASTLWPTTARAVRAEVMSMRTKSHIEAAVACGASVRRIVFRHILPGVIHISLLYVTIAVASALILEASFNFLGLTSPAVITWGQMLSFTYYTSTASFGAGRGMGWWLIFPPALAIIYMVLSFFFITTGLRESMRMKSIHFEIH